VPDIFFCFFGTVSFKNYRYFIKQGVVEIMTFFIRRCIIFFLIFELIVFFMIYCFGPKSIKTLHDIYQEKEKIQREIVDIEQENKKLLDLIEFHKTEFAKEKVAREVLTMKRDDEKVYFTKN
jgi:cell division protein FtsB